MTSKKFDCVEMKHNAAEHLRKRFSGKPLKEQIAFWREQQEEMLARQVTIQKRVKKVS